MNNQENKENKETFILIFDGDSVKNVIGVMFWMAEDLESVLKFRAAVERSKNDRSGGGEIMVEFTNEEFEEFGEVLSAYPLLETEKLEVRITKTFPSLEAWGIKW